MKVLAYWRSFWFLSFAIVFSIMATALMNPHISSVVHMTISPINKLTSVTSTEVYIHGIPLNVQVLKKKRKIHWQFTWIVPNKVTHRIGQCQPVSPSHCCQLIMMKKKCIESWYYTTCSYCIFCVFWYTWKMETSTYGMIRFNWNWKSRPKIQAMQTEA